MNRTVLAPVVLILLGLAVYLAYQPRDSHQEQTTVSHAGSRPAEEGGIPYLRRSSPHATSDLDQRSRTKNIGSRVRSDSAMSTLSSGEQASLWKAHSEARREVRPIPESRAQRVENQGYDFYALHPKQNLTTRFGSDGVKIVSSDRTYTEEDAHNPTTAWHARMRLRSVAGTGVQTLTPPEKSEKSSTRIEFHHLPGLTEWFENGVDGMEHGFTLATPPTDRRDDQPVSLEVALEGLQVSAQQRDDDTEALVFTDGEREVLSYSKLLVVDSRGEELPATMEPTPTGFTLAYHDAGAVYPVTVDPLIVNEEAKLNRYHGAPDDVFGVSVAIFRDLVVVGAERDDDAGMNSGSAYVFERSGSNWLLQDKLTADDAAAGDFFGYSVSIWDETVVVGAYGDETVTGSAYVFVRNNGVWSQQQKLAPGDGIAGIHFGFSVAIFENTAVVGAFGDSDKETASGAAYVYERSGGVWSLLDKLKASDPGASDFFGISVSISDDSMVVGAEWDDDGGSNSGSAYVFAYNGSTWTEEAKLVASDAAANDNFGRAVAITRDTIVVGAYRDDDAGMDSGSAYVFVRNGTSWPQQAKLTASDGATDDIFGYSVAISGDTVAVGAYGDDDNGSTSGSAYVFVRSGTTWSEQAKLTAFDGETQDLFGHSVAISGDTIIAGAFGDDYAGESNHGSAYVFTRSGTNWSYQTKLLAGDVGDGDNFGITVAISGDTAIVGARRDDDVAFNSGSAYIFVRDGTTWSQQTKLTAGDGSSTDEFGFSVALSGETAVIGTDAAEAAYIFVRDGTLWSQQAKLTANDGTAGDEFGRSVGISGDAVVIGARGDSDEGTNTGSAYVFSRTGTTWAQQDKLTASDAAPNVFFGESVAISNDSVVIGATAGDTDGGVNSGSAYIFTRNGSTWVEQDELTPSDGAAVDYFGFSVSISGNTVVVGSVFDNNGAGSNAGGAYVFTRVGSTWTEQTKLTASDGSAGERFGYSVSISGDAVAVSTRSDDAGPPTTGAAYVFLRSGTTWIEVGKLTASDAAGGEDFGISVAISGDTVLVGAMDDGDGASKSGSVYIYRFSLAGTNSLLVFDHLNVELINGGNATEFPGQALGTGEDFIFQLVNGGALDLDIQSVSLGGADSAQFGLVLPDISSPTDLASNESLDFTISFNPTGNTSGIRNAIVLITSNDPATVFSFNVSALGLSGTGDLDGDGMSDWGEFSLRGFGFDWETPQSNLVSDFYAQAHTAGLYTEGQIAGIVGDGSFFDVDPQNHTVDLVIELQQTLDLHNYTQLTLDPAKLSIDANGKLRYELDTSAAKKFFRAVWKD